MMLRPRLIAPAPERDSIFGDTYDGVPTPNTVVQHGYPTRFHGPNFLVPQLGHQFRYRPYARAPFLGLGDDALFKSVTGYRIWDGVLGAVAGYVAAPRHDQQLLYVMGGAAASAIMGWPAVAALVGLAAVSKFDPKMLQVKP